MNIGRYRILEQIGAGPDGTCHRAVHETTGQAVEVHLLAEARADFRRWRVLRPRLRVAAMFAHPLQLAPLDLCTEHEPPFAVFEPVPPQTLADLPAERRPCPEIEVLRTAEQMVDLLRVSHQMGLVLGDLRPGRWYRSGERLHHEVSGVRTRVLPGPEVEETAWTAPEERDGNPGDFAADIFRLGLLLAWLGLEQPVGAGYRADRTEGPAGEIRLSWLVQEMLQTDPDDRPGAQALTDIFATGQFPGNHDLDPTRLSQSPLPHVVPYVADPTRLQRIGRFILGPILGEGGLGRVYRGEDPAGEGPVAIKVLHAHLANRPIVVKRFRKEARLLREAANPHVANLLEINEDQGIHYLALEYLDGVSLNRLLRNSKLVPNGRLEENQILGLLLDVCRALADPHARGIIHRDIKPHNIMVLREGPLMRTLASAQTRSPEEVLRGGNAKLCDFGLARHVVETDSLHMTQEGAALGTPLYMSPEQASGRSNLDPTTDVYALGATFYHALAGRPPYLADTAPGVTHQHAHAPLPPLRQTVGEVGEGLARLIERCLAKDPCDRFPDAGAVLAEVERLVRGDPSDLVVHPILPPATNRVLAYDWSWELKAAPRQLWPYVADTDRLNRAAGLPPVTGATRAGDSGEAAEEAARHLEFRKAGVLNVWREHPFEWVEGRRLGVLREYSQGVFRWLASWTELEPRADGGTTLHHRVRVEPRNFFGRMAAALEIGLKAKHGLGRVYGRIDAYVRGGLGPAAEADPFEESPRLSRIGRRRLETLRDRMLEKGLPRMAVEKLASYLGQASEQDAARIRPLALARHLGVSEADLVAACLHGAREGMLVLLWDLLCPLCRIPATIVDTLQALRDHAHCPACARDFPVDFARTVEMIFRPHPQIRTCETRTYCVGGPAHSPHVVAQVRVAPGENLQLETVLEEGAFRLLGPQLPHALLLHVEPRAGMTRWQVAVPEDFRTAPAPDEPVARLRSGSVRLHLTNEHSREIILRLERTVRRADALTAARASTFALFRELFPTEILDAGCLVAMETVVLLVAEVGAGQEGGRNLYEVLGESLAFALVQDFVRTAEDAARRGGGTLVKVIDTALMLAFHDSCDAVRTALDLADTWTERRAARWSRVDAGLPLRLGIHEGSAMAATVNDRLDYFGLTVHRAWEILARLGGEELGLTRAVSADPRVQRTLDQKNLRAGPETSILADSLLLLHVRLGPEA